MKKRSRNLVQKYVEENLKEISIPFFSDTVLAMAFNYGKKARIRFR